MKRCLVLVISTALFGPVAAQDKPVFRCPGNLYTDSLSAKEASDRGCKTLDGAPITIIAAQAKRDPAKAPNAAAIAASAASGARGEGSRVDPNEQKARDSDRRKILEAELKKEEDALAAMQKDFNKGEPERKGDERNFSKYQERVADMKAAITRKESDIAALKRELAKLP